MPVKVGYKKVMALRGPLKAEGERKVPVLVIEGRPSINELDVTLEELRRSVDRVTGVPRITKV